jgi:exodeoxyribonuclease-3
MIRIVSWNVNGLRAAAGKGFLRWVARDRPDILGIQEARVPSEALTPALRRPKPFAHAAWAFSCRPGYSGVTTFSRQAPLATSTGLGLAAFDAEGRVVETEHEAFILYNVYFPKGSGKERDNSRVPFKLEFYDAFFAYALARREQARKPLVVMGDFNTAHEPKDLAHPRSNQKTSGFLPQERVSFGRHLEQGFVDTFRALHPERVQYSWWSQRQGVRERNVGWRIDYVWVSRELAPRVREAFILDQVKGSDHCPVGITLDV